MKSIEIDEKVERHPSTKKKQCDRSYNRESKVTVTIEAML
jgi:hypothetical protein